MTVAVDRTLVGPFAGDGLDTTFDYTFKIFDADDLEVIQIVDATDVETVKVRVTHYTVSGVGNSAGGTVTMVTAPPTGESLIIRRTIPLLQSLKLENQGAWLPQNHEDAYDRLTMLHQANTEETDRSLKFKIGFTAGRTSAQNKTSSELPDPVANRALIWDPTGLFIINGIQAAGNLPSTHVDNVLIKTDGTNTGNTQVTGISVDDSDNITGVAAITGTGNFTTTGVFVAGSGAESLTSAAGELLLAAIEQGGASTNDHLEWDGSAWAPIAITGGTITGTGTDNTIPLWNGTTALDDSVMTQSGSAITLAGTLGVSGNITSTSTGSVIGQISALNTSSGVGDEAARLFVRTENTGGDAYVEWEINSTQAYVMGIDNGSSDIFTGSVGSVVGTANWLRVTTAGAITFPDAQGVSVTANLDATTIGGGTPGTGAFSTLSTSGLATLASASVTANLDALTIGGGTPGTGAFTTLSTSGLATLASASVTANLDAASIGTGTPGTGAFSTLSTSGLATLASASVTANLDAATIGGGTPGTGDFTTVTTTGKLTVQSDTDSEHIIGRAKIGGIATDNVMYLSHFDQFTATNFAFAQSESGNTQMNAPTASILDFSINDIDIMQGSSTAIAIQTSIDLTMDSGDFTMTSGDITLTTGSAIITAGDVTVTAGDLDVVAGQVAIGHATAAAGLDVRQDTAAQYTAFISKDVTAASVGAVLIRQNHLTGAVACLELDQNDVSEGFMDLQGSGRGVVPTSTVDSVQSARIELNGTKYVVALHVDQ